jgi:acyl carrier protein
VFSGKTEKIKKSLVFFVSFDYDMGITYKVRNAHNERILIMQTIDKVKATIAKQLRIDVAEISDDSAIIEDLGADSIDIVEMLMTLEDEMNITIPDDVVGLKTVRDISEYIDSIA